MGAHVIEYYLDERLTKRLPVNEYGGAVMDWGETIPGMKKERTIYIKNTTNDKLALRQPQSEDVDLRVTDYPSKLTGKESGMVKLEFVPPKTRIKPLNAGWNFEIIVG